MGKFKRKQYYAVYNGTSQACTGPGSSAATKSMGTRATSTRDSVPAVRQSILRGMVAKCPRADASIVAGG
ncbi:hypothetical protein BCR44DRAFT_1440548, partial [Catenaria anguillulae PL171]